MHSDTRVNMIIRHTIKTLCLQGIITSFQRIIRAVILIYGYALHRKFLFSFILCCQTGAGSTVSGSAVQIYISVGQLACDCASVLTGWARPMQREGKISF